MINRHNTQIERFYDYGVIGNKNTFILNIEKAVDLADLEVVTADGESIDGKIIYSHPSELPMSHDTVTPTTYYGDGRKGFRRRRVNDSATLFVNEELPLEPSPPDLSDVKTLLLGDEKDTFLEGEYITLQARPYF